MLFFHLHCFLSLMLIKKIHFHAAITCDPLANITFGQYTNINCVTQKSFYNDTCEVMCDFGYVLHGPPVQRCTLKWEWAPKIKGHCERKDVLRCTWKWNYDVSFSRRAICSKSLMCLKCTESYYNRHTRHAMLMMTYCAF